ncbi:MAG: glucan biosynthesis protein, partial [Verrucomicrobiae bacterium]|nr:glucan biosynthesis protein [Verrucomicrobiae bacterium]
MTVRPSIIVLYALWLGFAWIGSLHGQYAKKSTTFSQIVEEAEKLSSKPYRPTKPRLQEEFLELDYDAYRKIHWNPKRSLWAEDDLNFRLEFFHPGYLFKTPVQINEFTESHIQNIPFTPEFFLYGDLEQNPRRISKRAGYAGFRLLFPLNEADKFDEVLSFLGASYFRALGSGQRYGKSARALALNTGLPVPEEFPEFTEFWIGKPDYEATQVKVFGLMDSPSVAGAFQFDIQPGKETIIDVESVLFFRNAVEWTGLAPLTSMYWYGENYLGRPADFRPEVHDSDGLLVQAEDGWHWRPLVNNGQMRRFTLGGQGIKGFGL